MKSDLRKLENSKKYGYLFYISYDGTKFDSFDENTNKKSVKGEFKEALLKNNISWAKGIQQAGRTDKDVSAEENILYISTNYNCFDLEKLKNDLNTKLDISSLFLKKIEKTFSDIVLPDMILRRVYSYEVVEKIKKNNNEIIIENCKNLSGIYDVSEYTDFKGEKLKNKIREVYIEYNGKNLIFKGESFMPKQVRIMSSYILSQKKDIYPAKYLSLNKIILKDDLKNIILNKVTDIKEDNVEYIEKTKNNIYFFYVTKKNKGEFIGKNGSNIKKLKKKYENIVVREL